MNKYLFRGSKANRDRRDVSFARSVIAEAERRRRLDAMMANTQPPPTDVVNKLLEAFGMQRNTELEDPKPIGECEHCSAAYYDEIEKAWHEAAECVGGMERFRL